MGKLVGFVLLLSVIVIWVGSSVAIQEMFLEIGFYKPFFLTYLSTALFSVYLVSLIWKRVEWGFLKKTAFASAQFCPLWFFANYFFNLSLGQTTVSSTTILSSSSGVFTLCLSILILKESPD